MDGTRDGGYVPKQHLGDKNTSGGFQIIFITWYLGFLSVRQKLSTQTFLHFAPIRMQCGNWELQAWTSSSASEFHNHYATMAGIGDEMCDCRSTWTQRSKSQTGDVVGALCMLIWASAIFDSKCFRWALYNEVCVLKLQLSAKSLESFAFHSQVQVLVAHLNTWIYMKTVGTWHCTLCLMQLMLVAF